jgi:hypothetical protein
VLCITDLYKKNQKIGGINMSLKLLLEDQGFGIRDEKNCDPWD